MRLGIPGGLLFYEYESFLVDFFEGLGIETVYSIDTDQEILDLGIKNCVDEACLPIKIFSGHAAKLEKECDYIAIPRVKLCPCGESICPKFEGLPELVRSGVKTDKCVFTEPLYLNDIRKVLRALAKGGKEIGISAEKVRRSLLNAYVNHSNEDTWGGPAYYSKLGLAQNAIGRNPAAMDDRGYKSRVLLAGHSYNIYDHFANRNVVKKLRDLGVGVVTGNKVNRNRTDRWEGLMKQPYWLFFIDNYGSAVEAANNNLADGIVYLSSFNCGTDSITVDMIKRKTKEMPMLVLKLDEQTGEAGLQTRLEAFAELLERRGSRENHLPPSGRRTHHGQTVFQ